MFFPTRGAATVAVREAKAICAACPVRQECLAWALDNPRRSASGAGARKRNAAGSDANDAARPHRRSGARRGSGHRLHAAWKPC